MISLQFNLEKSYSSVYCVLKTSFIYKTLVFYNVANICSIFLITCCFKLFCSEKHLTEFSLDR